MSPETLGEHLRKKRLDLGLSQKQVAREIGVDETTIYNWENRRTAPAVRLMPRLIEILAYAPWTAAQSLPERLSMFRRRMGLSQEKLAKLLEVDESSLANWERGRRQPATRCLEILEGLLKGDENDIIFDLEKSTYPTSI